MLSIAVYFNPHQHLYVTFSPKYHLSLCRFHLSLSQSPLGSSFRKIVIVSSLLLTPLTRFTALRFYARIAHSVHRPAHSPRSVPRGTLEILEYVFTLRTRFTGRNAFFIFTRDTPLIESIIGAHSNFALRLNKQQTISCASGQGR